MYENVENERNIQNMQGKVFYKYPISFHSNCETIFILFRQFCENGSFINFHAFAFIVFTWICSRISLDLLMLIHGRYMEKSWNSVL